MRRLLGTVLVVPLLALGACGTSSPQATITVAPPASGSGDGGGGGGAGGGGPLVIPRTAPSPDGVSDSPTCREVVAGIDAFNLGDYDSTVAHFKKAVPLAKAALEDDDSKAARDLLDAVLYYARLAPDQYPLAAGGSLDFAKYKAITLGQCEPVDGSGGSGGGSGGDDGSVPI